MRWYEWIGGRKFALSAAGLLAVVGVSLTGGSSEAFIAIGTIVLAYNGGNAAVEWKHAGASKGYTDTSHAIAERRDVSAGYEASP